MRNSPNRRAGPWLIILCVLAAAGTLYGVWKRVEPDIRYHHILGLFRSNQGRLGLQWGDADRRALWSRLSWFQRAPSELIRRLTASLASTDPEERETAALLCINLGFQKDEFGDTPFGSSPWVVPRDDPFVPTRFVGISGLVQDHADSLQHLAADERLVTRTCFLDFVRIHPKVFRSELAAMSTREPNAVLRRTAARLFWSSTGGTDAVPTLRQIAKDADPGIRLLALRMLSLSGDAEAFKEFITLLTDPRPDLEEPDRLDALEAIQFRFGPLASRLEDTRIAIRKFPEQLAGIREAWKAWFATKEFEEFAAEISRSR